MAIKDCKAFQRTFCRLSSSNSISGRVARGSPIFLRALATVLRPSQASRAGFAGFLEARYDRLFPSKWHILIKGKRSFLFHSLSNASSVSIPVSITRNEPASGSTREGYPWVDKR